jgi:hypothetical protein
MIIAGGWILLRMMSLLRQRVWTSAWAGVGVAVAWRCQPRHCKQPLRQGCYQWQVATAAIDLTVSNSRPHSNVAMAPIDLTVSNSPPHANQTQCQLTFDSP